MSSSYSAYVYPNVSRNIMGSNNPYIDHLKQALNMNGLSVDPAVATNAFFDLLRKGSRADMVIFNWIENLPSRRLGFLQTILFLVYIRLLKLKGTKIIWIRHNKSSHTTDRLALKKALAHTMSRYADHILVHSKDTDMADTSKLVFIPHPNNIDPADILDPVDPAESPDLHSAGKPVPRQENAPPIDFLIWGSLSPYKGVLEFLKFIRHDPAFKNFRLCIAGKSPAGYWKELQAHTSTNVELINEYIEEAELEKLFKRARFILFTYNRRSVMSSGVLIDSLKACKRIIAPDCGAFRDMADEQRFVSLYQDFSEIPALYRNNYDQFRLDRRRVSEFIGQNSWYNMGSKIKEFAGMAPVLTPSP